MRKTLKVKIIEESLWDRLPQHVKDEINGIINSKPKEMTEVVHGEWVLNDDQVYECNDCGYIPSFDGYTYFNYCPNCGAKIERREDGNR